MTVRVPEDLGGQLAAEASRRGLSVDEVAAEVLAAHYSQAGADGSGDALEAFIGSGSSGRRERFDIHKVRAELAERKLAEGI